MPAIKTITAVHMCFIPVIVIWYFIEWIFSAMIQIVCIISANIYFTWVLIKNRKGDGYVNVIHYKAVETTFFNICTFDQIEYLPPFGPSNVLTVCIQTPSAI